MALWDYVSQELVQRFNVLDHNEGKRKYTLGKKSVRVDLPETLLSGVFYYSGDISHSPTPEHLS